ncbi:hypothetical protein VTN49DRAFT_466 [Thermomyces lanuginosus]|uniref:uncharacterized protein n=1 Tax=Thermomyces lanuginosus TaxID=5541 RepID=UPI003741FCA7
MGLIGRFIKLSAYGGTAVVGSFFIWTRNCKIDPLPPSDYLWNCPAHRAQNPNGNATVNDILVRKVPLTQIHPRLLEKKGKLIEAFCAGVWGGIGFAFQRAYLARKYQGPQTAHQLWSTDELRRSTYEVGTEMTDHFKVVEKTDDRIIVRCGDSPLKTGLRESDGLFEMSVAVKKEEGVAEFYLKSLFFNGLSGSKEEKCMPYWIEWLHQQYAKLLMESAIQNVLR